MRDIVWTWAAGVLVGVAYLASLPLAWLLLRAPSAGHVAGAFALEAALVLAVLACLDRDFTLGRTLACIALLAAGAELAAPILRTPVAMIALTAGAAWGIVLSTCVRFTLGPLMTVLATMAIGVAMLT